MNAIHKCFLIVNENGKPVPVTTVTCVCFLGSDHVGAHIPVQNPRTKKMEARLDSPTS